jgi:hypothetical protein
MEWETVSKEHDLDGLSEQQRRFREGSVPVPSGVVRDTYTEKGWAFLWGIPDLGELRWIELPTSHVTMWSKPREIAAIVGVISTKATVG